MPIVKVPNTCEGCGACCVGLRVEVGEKDDIPDRLTVTSKAGVRYMKHREEDDACVCLDVKTLRCMIYDTRPNVCREFGPDQSMCFDQLAKRQAQVVTAESGRVEQILTAAIEYAISRGFAPDVTFRDRAKLDYRVNLVRTTFMADVRPHVLIAAEERMRTAFDPEIVAVAIPEIEGVTFIPKGKRPALGDSPGKPCRCGFKRIIVNWTGRVLHMLCEECGDEVMFDGKAAALFVAVIRGQED